MTRACSTMRPRSGAATTRTRWIGSASSTEPPSATRYRRWALMCPRCPTTRQADPFPLRPGAWWPWAGTFGYELDLGKLLPEEKEEVKEQVRAYKKYWRLIPGWGLLPPVGSLPPGWAGSLGVHRGGRIGGSCECGHPEHPRESADRLCAAQRASAGGVVPGGRDGEGLQGACADGGRYPGSLTCPTSIRHGSCI